MPNIHIYVPAFGHQIAGATVRSLMSLAGHFFAKGVHASFATNSFPDIADHRNIALTMWYDTMPQSTHLLFVDADMGFSPDLVTDMLVFDQPLVGAVYPKKTPQREWVVSGFGHHQPIEARAGFLKVAGLGCGVMLIRRDAVTKLLEAHPELIDLRINLHAIKALLPNGEGRLLRLFDLFDDPVRGRLSEDLSFCRRWTDLGGEVWGNIAHTVDHVGMHTFRGSYAVEASRGTAVAGEFPVKRGKHGVFKFNPNDTFVGRSLDLYGEWCDFELECMAGFIPVGATVIDVGANIGAHTVAFAKMIGPAGEVYAIEAQPRLFNLLCDNVKLNQLGNVKGICGVATDRFVEQVRLSALPPDDQRFNFGALPAAGDGNEYAPGDTIDALGLTRCDLIKIDVEGTEAEVIRGARGTIESYLPTLYVENNGPDSQALWDAFNEIQYSAYWSIGPYFTRENFFKNPVDAWPNTAPSANLIAVPSGTPPLDLPRLEGPDDNWEKVLGRMVARAAE